MPRDSVRLTGAAPQAAPLLKILDASGFFNSGAVWGAAVEDSGRVGVLREDGDSDVHSAGQRGVVPDSDQPEERQVSFGTLDRKTAILWISCIAAILFVRYVVLAD